ncbi:MAG TPA: helix-turn-helix transcriptional regulator [Polyangiaceae bacterium]|nr:helix-turn-helix transcriptional regulator [Polyangiaceae bacterium]
MKTHPVLFLNRPLAPLLSRARSALGSTQRELGDALGASQRTVARWEAGRSSPTIDGVRQLAALVYPHDKPLAEEIAAAASSTLEGLGLVEPPAPLAPPPLPAWIIVDAVVCSAADALKVAPEVVRPALLAAFRRARELRLSFEQVEEALAPPARVRAQTRLASDTDGSRVTADEPAGSRRASAARASRAGRPPR